METIEFELDMDLPDEVIEGLEGQILRKVREKFGDDYSGDDIEHYRYIFKAEVTVRDKSGRKEVGDELQVRKPTYPKVEMPIEEYRKEKEHQFGSAYPELLAPCIYCGKEYGRHYGLECPK